jgi:6,7-dimethyl-8-ribityllumazine synthase
MKELRASMNASGKRFGVVVTRWNEIVTKELLEGALDTLAAHGDPEVVVVRTPGSWELPLAAKRLIETHQVDAVVALGCILQGETGHAKLLAADVARALMDLQMATGVPVAWGVLTPDTAGQALERAGLKMGNKGREAALAAVEMAAPPA